MSSVLEELANMPTFVERMVRHLGEAEAKRSGPDGGFSFLEHAWHLADLEREGFGERIRRLVTEDAPFLPDFDGNRIARERGYRTLDLAEGLRRFRRAREENLRRLEGVTPSGWKKSGVLEGHGRLLLRDLPLLMVEHDRSHRREIGALPKAGGSS